MIPHPPPPPEHYASLVETNETLQRELAASQKTTERLTAMVEALTRKLDLLLHGKTKAPDAAKPPPPETPAAPPSPSTSPSPAPSSPIKSRRRDKHGRGAHPEDLPRDVTPTLRPDRCDRCGHERLLAAEQLVTEEYDYVRAHVRIRRTVREVCRCAQCNARVTPPQPPMPFDRAACTFEMMAWLLYAKCGLFLPLDRVRRDLERQGAPIPSATLTRWWQQGADLLQPIAGAVRLELLQGDHIHTDGTGLLVVFPRLKAEPKRAPARAGEVGADGYLLPQTPESGQVLVFCDDSHAVYHYTNDKRGGHAQDFLVLGQDKDQAPIRWTGTITADAASVHDVLFAEGDRFEAGCNAHGLRKFRDEADKAPLLASLAMGFIGRIYELDAEARAENLTGDALLAHRQTHSAPVMNELHRWLNTHITELLPKNPVRRAMQYYLKHWDALTRFLRDPKLKLDNNIAERDLRKLALLRKNALYGSGEEGARRLCTLLTLINTCARLGVEPYGYLVWAMTRVVPHPNNRGLTTTDLTPAAYKAAQQRGAQ